MTLICPKCELKLKVAKAGVTVEAMATFGSYQLLLGDRLVCPGCGMEVGIVNAEPFAEHYEDGYRESLDAATKRNNVMRFWATAMEKRATAGDVTRQGSHL